jgi:hypothetical protein
MRSREIQNVNPPLKLLRWFFSILEDIPTGLQLATIATSRLKTVRSPFYGEIIPMVTGIK